MYSAQTNKISLLDVTCKADQSWFAFWLSSWDPASAWHYWGQWIASRNNLSRSDPKCKRLARINHLQAPFSIKQKKNVSRGIKSKSTAIDRRQEDVLDFLTDKCLIDVIYNWHWKCYIEPSMIEKISRGDRTAKVEKHWRQFSFLSFPCCYTQFTERFGDRFVLV